MAQQHANNARDGLGPSSAISGSHSAVRAAAQVPAFRTYGDRCRVNSQTGNDSATPAITPAVASPAAWNTGPAIATRMPQANGTRWNRNRYNADRVGSPCGWALMA